MEKKTYIVADGAAVYAQGKTHHGGSTVDLTKADADRLLAAGTIRIPERAKGDKPSDPPADPRAALLEGTVAEVVDALEGLSDEDLAKLAELEGNGKDRKGVLDAVAALQAKRAEAGKD